MRSSLSLTCTYIFRNDQHLIRISYRKRRCIFRSELPFISGLEHSTIHLLQNSRKLSAYTNILRIIIVMSSSGPSAEQATHNGNAPTTHINLNHTFVKKLENVLEDLKVADADGKAAVTSSSRALQNIDRRSFGLDLLQYFTPPSPTSKQARLERLNKSAEQARESMPLGAKRRSLIPGQITQPTPFHAVQEEREEDDHDDQEGGWVRSGVNRSKSW